MHVAQTMPQYCTENQYFIGKAWRVVLILKGEGKAAYIRYKNLDISYIITIKRGF